MSFRYYKGKKEGSDWCIHGALTDLEAAQGTTVTLTTSKGATKTEQLGEIVARFPDGNGLAKIVRERTGAQPSGSPRCLHCGKDPYVVDVPDTSPTLAKSGDIPF